MAIDFNNELKKKAPDFGTDIKIHRTTWRHSRRGGGSPGSGPDPGETIPGGGVVTDVTSTNTSTTTTIDFPDGTVPEHPDLPRSATTAEMKFGPAGSDDPGGGIYVNGQGPTVGQQLPGGGVVTAVGTDTVTISYPDGAPTGPIQVPWEDTTVIDEPSPTDAEIFQVGFAVSLAGGLSLNDLSIPTQGTAPPGTTAPNTITASIPNPGGLQRSLRLAPQTLKNFSNSITSATQVFVVFIGVNNKILPGGAALQPNQSVPKIVPPPGTKAIAIMTPKDGQPPGFVTVSWEGTPP